MTAASETPILEVDDLVVEFRHEHGHFAAVDGLSYKLKRGETLGVVGESGSGKSVTNLAIMGLLPRPPARIPRGKILFHGKDLVNASERELQKIRGNRIAMIFQDPMTSLNPYLKVGRQLTEVVELHQGKKGEEARQIALHMLERVGIPGAAKRIDQYPHQFSGGHVIVMYAGRVMEQGSAIEVFRTPSHPYTLGLLQSIPRPDLHVDRLYSIPGRPPDIDDRPPGCPFAPRCRFKQAACDTQRPALTAITQTHASACFAIAEVQADAARSELLDRVAVDVANAGDGGGAR